MSNGKGASNPSTSAGGGIAGGNGELIAVTLFGSVERARHPEGLLALYSARHLPGAERSSVTHAVHDVGRLRTRARRAEEVAVQRMHLEPGGSGPHGGVQGLGDHHAAEDATVHPPLRAGGDEGRPPLGVRACVACGDGVDQLGHGGRDDLGLFGLVKLHRTAPLADGAVTGLHLDLDSEVLGGQVHAAVVLGVTETLDIEEPDLGSLQRERAPVPGAPVQHQGLEGLDPEGTDGGPVRLGLVPIGELDVRPAPRRSRLERSAASGPGCGCRGGTAFRSAGHWESRALRPGRARSGSRGRRPTRTSRSPCRPSGRRRRREASRRVTTRLL